MKLDRFAASAGLLILVSACAESVPPASPESPGGTEQGGEQPGQQETRKAEAKLQSPPGMKLAGDAKFVEENGAVKITVDVEDAPSGYKGIHIHEKGDCSDPKGKSMGEHFAPGQHNHGIPGKQAEHHLGDLGNIMINADGKGHLEFTVPEANLKPGDPMSFLGRAVIIHEGEDKGVQPSGEAGDPIACGRIDPK